MRWAQRLWQRVAEPRHLKMLMLWVYLATSATGIATLCAPPHTVEAIIGGTTAIWSALVIVGGVGGVASVLPGWWWVERLSIFSIWVGMAIYLLVLAWLQSVESGSRLTQMGFLVVGALALGGRFLQIRKYSFEPRE